MLRLFLVALAATAVCPAQWEAGVATGYGIYHNGTIISPAGNATAGIRNRFVFSLFAGEDRYEHLSGEFRYTYHDGDPFLASGSAKANIQGQSHALHYDLLLHLRPRDRKVRPYFAIGAGVKQYVVSGPANPAQPLSKIGLLTTNDQTKVLATAGGGVNWQLRDHIFLRLDFRDYITTFPRQLIVPVRLATARGIMQQFTPMAGVGFSF